MAMSRIVPPHMTGEQAVVIASAHPALFGYRIDRDTAKKLADTLRRNITADMIIEQLALSRSVSDRDYLSQTSSLT